MHTNKFEKIFPFEVLFVILYFLLDGKKSAIWDYENLHCQIRKLKNRKKYEKILEEFTFDNLGISAISNKLVDSIFTLTASNILLLIVFSNKEKYALNIEKKEKIFSKFSKKEINLLSQIAKEIKITL
jgi:hypothetical protein